MENDNTVDNKTTTNNQSEPATQPDWKSQLREANQRIKELETKNFRYEQAQVRAELLNKYVIDKANQAKLTNFLDKYQIKDQTSFITDFYQNYLKQPDKQAIDDLMSQSPEPQSSDLVTNALDNFAILSLLRKIWYNISCN